MIGVPTIQDYNGPQEDVCYDARRERGWILHTHIHSHIIDGLKQQEFYEKSEKNGRASIQTSYFHQIYPAASWLPNLIHELTNT